MSHYINSVKEFHLLFGHPVKTEKQEDIFDEKPERVKLRLGLIDEEFKELCEAYDTNDMVEVADALADITYVVAGAALTFGVDFGKSVEEAYQEKKKTFLRMGVIPDWKAHMKYRIAVTHSYFKNLVKACKDKDLDAVEKSLGQLCLMMLEMSTNCSISLTDIFNEVHRSNMTKGCDTLEDAEESVRVWKEDGRYEDPIYEKSKCGKYYIVKDGATDKILKNHKYTRPDILRVMKASKESFNPDKVL